MSVYLIADLHLGHESMAVKRGFKNADEMFEYIKERWNKVVDKRDLVYILGDVTMEKRRDYPLLDQLQGQKYVVLGNHDLRKDVDEMRKYVDGVAGLVKYKGVFLSHCPIHPMELDYRVSRCVHGHIHEKSVMKKFMGIPYKKDKRYICVSCEQVDYTPIEFNKLINRRYD